MKRITLDNGIYLSLTGLQKTIRKFLKAHPAKRAKRKLGIKP